jgi:hypothetical protein
LYVGFIDYFNTQLVTTPKYSAIADLHNLQFTVTHAKSFPVRNVFTSSCLATALIMDIFLLPGSSPV